MKQVGRNILLCIVISGLVACGGGGGTSSEGPTTTAETGTTAPPPATPGTPETPPIIGPLPDVPIVPVVPVPPATSWADLAITSADRQITVSWAKKNSATASKNVTYNLYWKSTPGVSLTSGTKIEKAISPYTHTALKNDSIYYYVVTEVLDGAESAASLEIAATPQANVPAVSTGITISPLDARNQITIARSKATNIKYHLYWSSGTDTATGTKIVNAFGSGTSFIHTGLTNGTPYYYAVSAETTEGEGPKSPAVMSIPLADIIATKYVANSTAATIAAPNAINAFAGSQAVTLTWNLPQKTFPTVYDPAATPVNEPVISSYILYWSKSYIKNPLEVAKITIPVTGDASLPFSFVHNYNLTNGTPYYYLVGAVSATDSEGEPLRTANGTPVSFVSPLGSQVRVVPMDSTSSSPTGLTVTSGSQQISLKWNEIAGDTISYRVYMTTQAPVKPLDVMTSGTPVVTTAKNSYIHTGLQSGKTYYYVVTSILNGESGPSAIAGVQLW